MALVAGDEETNSLVCYTEVYEYMLSLTLLSLGKVASVVETVAAGDTDI